MVITDAFSKLVRLEALRSKAADEVGQAIFRGWILTYGVPKIILTDQGREFQGALQEQIFSALRVNRIVTAPYHPQTNSQAEVFNKTMMGYLTKMLAQAEEKSVTWEKL